jgi:WD40 repeat protein
LIWDVETGKALSMLSSEPRRMVSAVAYSADAKFLASGGLDQAVRIWNATSHRELLALHGHASGVTCLAFRPDSLRVASGSEDGVVKIWDAVTRPDAIRVAAEPGVRHTGLAFSPDGRWVAYATQDYRTATVAKRGATREPRIQLREAADGAPGPTLRGHTDQVVDLAFDPGGTRIAAADTSGAVTVWEIPSGGRLLTLRPRSAPARESMRGGRLIFGPDAGQLTFADFSGTVTVWETPRGREVDTFRALPDLKIDPLKQNPLALAFSADGRRLASGETKAIRLWDLLVGKEVATLHAGLASVFAVALSPDGRKLAAALVKQGGSASAGEIKVWDLATAEEVVTFAGASGGTSTLAFTPDGKRLVSTGPFDREVMVWDAISGRELLALRIDDPNNLGGPGGDGRLAFSPDGTRLALVGLSGLSIWQATPAPEVLTLHSPVAVWGLAYSPDGRHLATADNHEAASIRDALIGRTLRTLSEPDASVDTALVDLRYSPDGRRVAAAIATRSLGTVTVWNAINGQFEGRLSGHKGHIINLAFSPNGRLLATASHDKTVKIWDAVTLKPLLTLVGHADRVNDVVFLSDGRRVASACRDGTLKLWDAANGHETAAWRSHKGAIVSVALSPDGRFLAAGGGRRSDHAQGPAGEVKIWDVATRSEVLDLPGVTHFIHSVAFSPDGRLLASAGEDRLVRLWELATGRALVAFRGHNDIIKRVVFSPDGRCLASCGEDRTVRVHDISRRSSPTNARD